MSYESRYSLAESACVEPLVGRWIAWPHVMAPITHGLHLSHYQLPALKSYLENPAIHEASCKNPKLMGGAFVNIPRWRAGEVETLAADSEARFSECMEFARALTEFHNMLVAEAKGDSLESYYEKLPRSLCGCVELLYDYYNRPIVRPIEGILYKSDHYRKDAQSLRLFVQGNDFERPYYMSTPRLADEESLDWNVAFDDPRIDELFALDVEPKPFDEIRSLLGVSIGDEEKLRPLLQEAIRPVQRPWNELEVRVRYFGHACVLVEKDGVSILIDPLISPLPTDQEIERFSFGDLPARIDYVLITHGHHDHFVIETLLRLRRKIGTLIVPKSSGVFYGDLSLKLLARQLGFKNVVEADSLDEFEFPGGRIVVAPFLGEHNDLPNAKTAYAVCFGERSLLFAADSNCLDANIYAHLIREIGSVDTLFVGMECVGAPLTWVYGPILPYKPEHRHSMRRRSNGCNADAALNLARAVRCRRSFVYAVGREPWVRYLLALTPADDDVYMVEIEKYIRAARDELRVTAELLFGKAEIMV